MRHPPLPQLADHLRDVARQLDRSAGHDPARSRDGTCRCVECRARLLAARGWPTGTLGDGTGSRAADATSSTERAAIDPGSWATVGDDLARALRTIWSDGLRVLAIVDRINAHAPDDDPLPAGTGPCAIRTCDTTCRPDHRNPDNRLRSGLCPACWKAWERHLRANPMATLVEWRPVRTAQLRPKPTP